MNNYQKWLQRLSKNTITTMSNIEADINQLRQNGKVIYPPNNQVLSGLRFAPPEDIKVLIVGQDPYHQPGQATGTAFSVQDGITFPPSLRNIYTELVSDCNVPYPTSGDLAPWAKQGVLLLNTSLTVEDSKPASHADKWLPVTKDIIMTVLNTDKPLVILCWGSPAMNLIEDCISKTTGSNNVILKSTHPSPFSANKASSRAPAFIGSKSFSKTNDILLSYNLAPIDWKI